MCRRVGNAICQLPVKFSNPSNPPKSNFLLNISFHHQFTMSTAWNVLLDETLGVFLERYVEAWGDAARGQILKDCAEAISHSPMLNRQNVELPEDLCLVRILSH
jgi:hypothetical protein